MSNHTFNITLPSGLSSGDIIVGFLCANTPHAAFIINEANSSNNFNQDNIWGFYPGDNFSISFGYVFARSLSSGNALQINTAWYGYDGKPITGTFQNCKITYIFYRISGSLVNPLTGNPVKSTAITMTLGTSNWNLGPIPVYDDLDARDYLWLLGVGAESNAIATVAPSTYGSLVTEQGLLVYANAVSVSSCYKTTLSTISQDDPGTFTAPECDWIGYGFRIYPSGTSVPEQPDPEPPSGVGFMVPLYRKEAYIIPPPIIEVYPAEQNYNSDGSPDIDNPYGYYVQVSSNASWTASWNAGTYFIADQYSGNAGVTLVSISCNSENTSGSSYTDTLVFDMSGYTDSVNVIQVSS